MGGGANDSSCMNCITIHFDTGRVVNDRFVTGRVVNGRLATGRIGMSDLLQGG